MKDGRGGKWSNAALIKGYDSHQDMMPHDKYVEWQRACLNAMMGVLRNYGAIFYNHKWQVQNGLLQDRQDFVRDSPYVRSYFGKGAVELISIPDIFYQLTR